MRQARYTVVTALGLGITLITGCGGGETETSALTTTEQTAVDAAVQAAQALSNATEIAQNPTTEAQDASPQQAQLEIGACPIVSTQLNIENGIELEVDLDFGSGCAVLGEDSYTCSGRASGKIAQLDSSMSMSFEALACADGQLDGSTDLTFEADAGKVRFEGDWNLTLTKTGMTTTTAGNGISEFDFAEQVSTIPTYQGVVTDGETDWSMTVSELKTSVANHGSFIPYAGSLTLSGSGIRTLVVSFDENSPSTGEITVQIGSTPPFAVDLDTL